MTYDTVEIEDMDWSEELQAFTYQCPCGDLFQITMVRLASAIGSAPQGAYTLRRYFRSYKRSQPLVALVLAPIRLRDGLSRGGAAEAAVCCAAAAVTQHAHQTRTPLQHLPVWSWPAAAVSTLITHHFA